MPRGKRLAFPAEVVHEGAPPGGVDVPLRRPESAGQAFLEHLSPGAGPGRRGHGIIPLDLPGQAEERGGVLQSDGRLARFEALVAAPERKASQVGCAGYGEPSLGAGWRDDTYPRRGLAAGRRRGVSTLSGRRWPARLPAAARR